MSAAAREVTTDVLRAELEAVLSSDLFVRAPSLAQFLKYICLKAIEGEGAQIKEYNIAVEALGRPANFDQKGDAIVRVEAHRLRKRLKQYYETEGAERTLQIIIPPGQYVPQFIPRDVPQPERPAPRRPARASKPPAPEPPAAEVVRQRTSPARRWTMQGAAAVLSASVLAAAFGVAAFQGAPAASRTEKRVSAAGRGGIRVTARSEPFHDRTGRWWQADEPYASGGSAIRREAGMKVDGDAGLYVAERSGAAFTYAIPAPPGKYTVALYFAESEYGPNLPAGGGEGSRTFSVYANGAALLHRFDVYAAAGGSQRSVVRRFHGVAPDAQGKIVLAFVAESGAAMVNAIEVVPED